jgi:hypothetical protein
VADFAPAQAPEPTHEVAFVADQESVALPPLFIALGPTLSVTVGADALTETVADCAALPPMPVHVSVKVALADNTPVDCEPLIPLLPLHPPDAVQAVAFVADQVSVELVPLATELGAALSRTVGAGELTETVADCVALPPDPVHVNE